MMDSLLHSATPPVHSTPCLVHLIMLFFALNEVSTEKCIFRDVGYIIHGGYEHACKVGCRSSILLEDGVSIFDDSTSKSSGSDMYESTPHRRKGGAMGTTNPHHDQMTGPVSWNKSQAENWRQEHKNRRQEYYHDIISIM